MTEPRPLKLNNVKPQHRAWCIKCLVTDKKAELVGKITILWGQFELEFDLFLAAMMQNNGCDVPHWERQNFKKRRKLFKEQATISYADEPETIAYIQDMLHASARLHIPRNLLAHGTIEANPAPEETFLIATGRHNGEKVRGRFGLVELEVLVEEMERLCGQMFVIDRGIVGQHASLPDSSTLQALSHQGPPIFPTRPKPSPPPQSSET